MRCLLSRPTLQHIIPAYVVRACSGGGRLSIQHIHTFLVRPAKGGHEKLDIKGTSVPLSGGMFNLLNNIYMKSQEECDIDISFRPASDGQQQNDCRDLVIRHLKQPTLETGRLLAERLSYRTDNRSGLGLLFLIVGKEGDDHRIVISRFPTDNAILVDDETADFTVQFLERVFMKNKSSYKAVLYQDQSLQGGFWTGRAVDKQLNSSSGHLSAYWITEFLASQFATTPAAGSRRLAMALLNAISRSPLDVKQELIAAATLASGLAGSPTSITAFMDQYNLSESAKQAITGGLQNPATAQEQFIFDVSEFRKYVAFKSVELDNGVTITANYEKFASVIKSHNLDDGRMEYSTTGTVVNES